jgi:nucleoside 2-deoxyribosyltransferase
MKVYIALKYEPTNTESLRVIKEAVLASKYTPYAFVEEGYMENEKEMMKTAFQRLEECDVLIVEGSNVSLGVGIEVGYFLRTGKPIIALFKENIISRTLQGVATKVITYSSEQDLKTKLALALV